MNAVRPAGLVFAALAAIAWFVSLRYYGPANLLWFSNLGVAALAVGLLGGWPLITSAAATGLLAVEIVWGVDFLLRLIVGGPVLGLTEYVFEPPTERPLWARLVALYHLALPPGLLFAASRLGYDRRGLLAWLAFALIVSAFCLIAVEAELNVNRVRGFGPLRPGVLPTGVYFSIWYVGSALFLWGPTHLLLSRLYDPPR